MWQTLTMAIIIWGLPCLAWAQQPALPKSANEAEAILGFAEHLFSEGEYYRAITEYNRLLFFYPQHPKANEVRLQIGNCYLKGERWDEVLEHFQALLPLRLPQKMQIRLLYKMAECYYAKREYASARHQLEQLISQFPLDPEIDQARYLIGQSYLKQAEWIRAAEAFGRISNKRKAEELSQETLKGLGLAHKSPTLAGGLSAAMPGLGQLYAGRRQDALMAFLLNGVFIWGTVEAFRHDKEVAGGILLFFELGWYGGNIYSAASSTHKYNQKLNDDFRDSLNSRFQFSLGSLQGNVSQPYLGLSYMF